MIKKLVIALTALLAWAGVLVGGPLTAAQASYPGRNGRIAFAMADSTGRHIYSVRADGSGLRQLTSGAVTDLCPAYSPDGRTIAFCSGRSGNFEIWTMTAAGTDLTQLTDVSFATFPDFSPDGNRIAFDGRTADDPNDEIFVMNADGSGLTQLTDGEGNNDWPAWAPYGHTLAFISDRTGVEQVFTMRANGRHQKQLTFQPVPHDQLPDWSPDGTRIAYEQGDTGVGQIWVMNDNGTDQHQVSSGPGDDFGPAWSPDGRQIAFVRAYPNGDRPVMVMRPDGTHVRTLVDPTGDAVQYVPAWQPHPYQ